MAFVKFGAPPSMAPMPNCSPGTLPLGHRYSTKEHMTPESHERRMAGLRKAWAARRRKVNGEKFMSVDKQKRKRARLRLTVAKEAREIQELARKGANTVMERLIEIATVSQNETAAIAAASVVMDRAYGKANQTNINATVDANGKPTDVSEKELNTRIEKALQRVRDLTGGASKAPASEERPADVREHDRDTDGSTYH